MNQYRGMNDNISRGKGLPAAKEDLEKEVAEAKRRERLLPPYEMTGYTGSLRYMAPEVAVNQAYDESVDVYSLSLVLWEIASLERPYKGYNKAKFFDRVVRHKVQPDTHPPSPFFCLNLVIFELSISCQGFVLKLYIISPIHRSDRR